MNKMILTVAVCGIVLGAFAENAANSGPRLTALERKAKLDAVVNQKVGGFVDRPGSGRGEIVYVNCQQAAQKAWIEESIAYFTEVTKFRISYVEGAFDFKNPKVEGNATIFIVNDEALPTILVAPENRWAMVNVSQISKERRPIFVEQRTKKELSRAFAYLCGATGSRYERSLTRGITSLTELDKNPDYELPMDVVQRFWDYMKPLGVQPVQRATYMKACQEGWAPAPTNEVQQVIWEQIHAKPTEPMKIKFDSAKGE